MEPRRRPEPFRPVATLGLVYFAAIFIVIMLVLISPTLWEVARVAAPAEEKRRLIEIAARDAARPKLPIAFIAALGATALALRAGVLPGFRPPRR